MKALPETEHPLVLRTDFSNQAVWDATCATIREPVDGYRAYVEFLDNKEYENVAKDQILELVPGVHPRPVPVVWIAERSSRRAFLRRQGNRSIDGDVYVLQQAGVLSRN
jgi:hypothetical protein